MAVIEPTLTSFLPALAVRQLAAYGGTPELPFADRLSGAVLLADIAGSTAMAEQLAAQGPIGAEQLSARFNAYFGKLIDIVAARCGEVYRFAGDALLAVWPVDERTDLPLAAWHAARCSALIQAAVREAQFSVGATLSVRIGVGAGDLLAAHIGAWGDRVEFVLAGDPLDQLSVAMMHAGPGQSVLSPQAWALLHGAATGGSLPHGFRCLETVREPPHGCYATESITTPVPPASLRAYVPGAVLARLDARQMDWLAELRRITALFVRVPGIDYRAVDALDRLQAAMTAANASLAELQGSLRQFVVDDKGTVLVAAFGLPPATHEDDVIRGVLAASAIQNDLRRLGFIPSVGVATGRAFCGPVGNDARHEYAVVGDVMNTAARLMEGAAGEILCDEATRAVAQTRVRFLGLPPMVLKGKDGPTSVFRPVAELPLDPTGPKLPSRPGIVGREAERDWLTARLAELVRGGQGGVVVIEGDAGVGKSRLVEDLVAQAEGLGLRMLIGAADPIAQSTPYAAWREVYRQLLGLGDSTGDLGARQARVRSALDTCDDPRDDADSLRGLAPLLNSILPLDLPENALTLAMSGEARADNMRELLVRLLQCATRTHPHLLVLEDAHWLDSASWRLLHLVSYRVSGLLLVIAARPPSDPVPVEYRELVSASGAGRICLDTLAPGETIELACRTLGVASVPPPVGDFVWERTRGHPAFCEELAIALREAGVISVAGGQCHLAPEPMDAATASIPSTQQGVLTNRIDRLSPTQQLTLKVASVIGTEFSLPTLEAVYPTEMAAGQIHDDLAELTQLEMIVADGADSKGSYRFRHAIVHETVYGLMLFGQRRTLHRAVAEWYESKWGDELGMPVALLAHHWTHALGSPDDEPEILAKAIAYLELAGETAAQSYANVEAIRYFDQAIKLTGSPADSYRTWPRLSGRPPNSEDGRARFLRQARWERQIGEAYFRLGKAAEASTHLRKALGLMGHPAPSVGTALASRIAMSATLQLLHHLLPRNHPRPVAEAKQVQLLEAAGAYKTLAMVTFIALDELASIDALLRGHDLAEAAGPSPVLVRTNFMMGNFLGLLFASRPLHQRFFRRALEVAESLGDPASLAELWFGRGFFLAGQADWAAAREATERAATLWEEVGDRRWLETARFQNAAIGLFQGEFAASRAQCLAGERSAWSRGDVQAQSWFLIQQAHAVLMLGEPEEALRLLSEVDDRLAHRFTTLSDPSAELWGLATRALAHARLEERQPAIAAAEAAARLIKRYLDFTYYSARGYGNLAAACLELWETVPAGASPERKILQRIARQAVAALRRYSRSSPAGRPITGVWRGLTEWLTGHPEEASEAWRAAITAARRQGMPYEEAMAHYQLGRSLPSSAPAHAEHLECAAEIFARLGATHDLELAQRAQPPANARA
jgi:class 3 adenylate cyclase/tetratricopeptide (TPR) repeat protein